MITPTKVLEELKPPLGIFRMTTLNVRQYYQVFFVLEPICVPLTIFSMLPIHLSSPVLWFLTLVFQQFGEIL